MKAFNTFLITALISDILALWTVAFVDNYTLNYILAIIGLIASITLLIIATIKHLKKAPGFILFFSSLLILTIVFIIDMSFHYYPDNQWENDNQSPYINQTFGTIDSNGQFIDQPFDSLLIDPEQIQNLPVNTSDTTNLLPPAPM